MGHRRWEEFMDPGSEGIDWWPRDDVGRAALQHGDVGSCLCERRQQSHGRWATAHDDHFLVLVVEIIGPELGMENSALEILNACYMAAQRFFIVVIPGAEDDEACVEARFMAIFVDK